VYLLLLPLPPTAHTQVISAFEGYAFDAGMRPGDRLISVGGVPTDGLTVEGVKDLLRGAPDTEVAVKFTREGLTSPTGPVPQEVQFLTVISTVFLVQRRFLYSALASSDSSSDVDVH
jgi:PDZ domain